MPQTDIENRYKNYKVKSILIESNSPRINIKVDHYYDLFYNEKIDLSIMGIGVWAQSLSKIDRNIFFNYFI